MLWFLDLLRQCNSCLDFAVEEYSTNDSEEDDASEAGGGGMSA